MYYKLKEKWKKELFLKAYGKEGNFRKLAKKLEIAKSALYEYKNHNRPIPQKVLDNLIILANESFKESHIKTKLPSNWKQIIGGKNRVKKSLSAGTFQEQLSKCHKGSSIYMKQLHKKWKIKDPKSYYTSQYEKFKKIGEYKYITKNGEKVRNQLEKDTADKLRDMGISYQFEPYIFHKSKAFFPDFLINDNIIIECTAWKGYDKAIKLKNKIDYLKDKYTIYVLIPKALNKYYQILNEHLIYSLDESPLSSVR